MSRELANPHQEPNGYYESERAGTLKHMPQGTRTTLEFGCGFGGFSAASNQGIAGSRGEYVLLLNPDTILLTRYSWWLLFRA